MANWTLLLLPLLAAVLLLVDPASAFLSPACSPASSSKLAAVARCVLMF